MDEGTDGSERVIRAAFAPRPPSVRPHHHHREEPAHELRTTTGCLHPLPAVRRRRRRRRDQPPPRRQPRPALPLPALRCPMAHRRL